MGNGCCGQCRIKYPSRTFSAISQARWASSWGKTFYTELLNAVECIQTLKNTDSRVVRDCLIDGFMTRLESRNLDTNGEYRKNYSDGPSVYEQYGELDSNLMHWKIQTSGTEYIDKSRRINEIAIQLIPGELWHGELGNEEDGRLRETYNRITREFFNDFFKGLHNIVSHPYNTVNGKEEDIVLPQSVIKYIIKEFTFMKEKFDGWEKTAPDRFSDKIAHSTPDDDINIAYLFLGGVQKLADNCDVSVKIFYGDDGEFMMFPSKSSQRFHRGPDDPSSPFPKMEAEIRN